MPSGFLAEGPVVGVVQGCEKIDIGVFHPAAEPFKFVIIVEEGSWLPVVQNSLVALPKPQCIFFGEGAAEFPYDGVEFGVLECGGVEGAVLEVRSPDDELEGEGFSGEA